MSEILTLSEYSRVSQRCKHRERYEGLGTAPLPPGLLPSLGSKQQRDLRPQQEAGLNQREDYDMRGSSVPSASGSRFDGNESKTARLIAFKVIAASQIVDQQ